MVTNRLLRDLVSEDFVLVRGEWPAPEADALVRALKPGWVIVESPGPAYHVISRWETLQGLAQGSAGASTGEALGLAALPPAPVLDAYAVAENLPELCVVLDGGALLGFYDSVEGPNHLRGGDIQYEELAHRLVADFPASFAPGEKVTFFARLITDPDFEPRLEVGTEIRLLARASGALRLDGPSEAALIFDGKERSRSAGFEVTAAEAGTGRAEIHAHYRQESLGDLTFSAVVQEGAAVTPPKDQEVILSRMSVKSADLTLVIQEHRQDGQRGLRLWLTADDPQLGLNMTPSGPVLFNVEPRTYFQELFRDFEELQRNPSSAAERTGALGEILFETIFPEDLRGLLWFHRHRLRSIHVLSEEPWIPWELCKLHGPGTDGIEDGEFLCEAFVLTRWPLGRPRRPHLQLMRMAVIEQEESGLATSELEREFLLSLATGKRQVETIPADYLAVRQALASGLYNSLHFVGHGAYRAGDRSRIALTSRQELRPQDLTGRVANLGKGKPFVFLNACETGQGGSSLVGMGGWAHSFLGAGAAAFLGPFWHVRDESASSFAQIFYPRLLKGDATIGEAVRQTRLEMRQLNPGDPTRLAYTLFADPQAKVLG